MAELTANFRTVANEELAEFLELAGREPNMENARLAVHLAILHANEFGQPGQELRQAVTETGGSQPKRANTDEAHVLELRIKQLEEKAMGDSVETLKHKVRALALQAKPSESVILMHLDELARVARKCAHPEADEFEELARQASKHQGKLSISSLCLSVIGGRASDAISKALAKCLKEKQFETDLDARDSKLEMDQKSPLANIYPPQIPMFYPVQQVGGAAQYPAAGYGFQGFQGQRYTRPPMRPPRPRGLCMFCESPDHYIKDCDKMKEARKK